MNTQKDINHLALTLFNSVIKTDNISKCEFIHSHGVFLNEYSAPSKSDVISWLNKNKLNKNELNQTFHKSWNKIKNSTRLELLIDQIIHYMTSYGTNFSGPIYIPDENMDVSGLNLPVYSIGALTQDELIEKCKNMLSSGIALSEETIEKLFSLLNKLSFEFSSVDWINNREALIYAMDILGIFPSDPIAILRFVIFKITDSTLLIKNNNTYDQIESSHFDPTNIFNDNKIVLSTIFNRFKPIFLSFKKKNNSSLNKVINHISKLSKVHHVPMVQNPLNMISNHKLRKFKDKPFLDNATPFALFKALNACHLYNSKENNRVYKIRNGKTWITNDQKIYDSEILDHNIKILEGYIKQKFKHLENKTVYIPDYIDYGLPISEKKYLGKLPYGTRIKGKNLVVGIFWNTDYNARDLDLSAIDSFGDKIGWNSHYNHNGIYYSGDMTYPGPKGATEYLYGSENSIINTIVMVNCYNGEMTDHSYDIIAGLADDPTQDYMMNPENLIISEKYNSKNGSSFTGIFNMQKSNKEFILYPMSGGASSRVSLGDDQTLTALRAFVHEANTCLTLSQLFAIIGVKVINSMEKDAINLDPLNINKSTLIDLFKV